MDAADPSLTIVIAVMGFLGLTVAPIAVALINKGGKSQPAVVELDPDKVMPRKEYDGLLEQMARLDDECDRLARENTRLREGQETERRQHAEELARLQPKRKGTS